MQVNNEIAFAIEYLIIHPTLNFDLNLIDDNDRKNTILKYQGKAVKLIGNFKVEEICYLYSLIYNTTTELVFEDYLIFNNNPINAIRPKNIKIELSEKIDELRDKYWSNSQANEIEEKITLSIDDLFKTVKSEKEYIDLLFQTLKTTEILILKGEVSNLALLISLYISHTYADNVYFEFSPDKYFQIIKY